MRRVSISGLVRVGALAALVAALATAQPATAHRTIWAGVYTEAQAARGRTAFGESCSGCHSLEAGGKSPLVGEPFWKSFQQKTVAELLDYVSANMPNGAAGTLNESTYRDIVALMLSSNGFPAGATELQRDNIADVQIMPKDAGAELPADAFVRVVGCLAKRGSDWVVTRATAPERAEREPQGGEDAARPLGTRTMQLKFVLTKLDPLAGSRVLVNGMLIGEGGKDGINVTTVSRVAAKCP